MELYATVGITEPNFARDPLGTEAEMTPGPNDRNPYDEGDIERQPQLAPLLGGGFDPGGGTVEEINDATEDRNRRLDTVFAFGAGPADEFPDF